MEHKQAYMKVLSIHVTIVFIGQNHRDILWFTNKPYMKVLSIYVTSVFFGQHHWDILRITKQSCTKVLDIHGLWYNVWISTMFCRYPSVLTYLLLCVIQEALGITGYDVSTCVDINYEYRWLIFYFRLQHLFNTWF